MGDEELLVRQMNLEQILKHLEVWKQRGYPFWFLGGSDLVSILFELSVCVSNVCVFGNLTMANLSWLENHEARRRLVSAM